VPDPDINKVITRNKHRTDCCTATQNQVKCCLGSVHDPGPAGLVLRKAMLGTHTKPSAQCSSASQ